jgi:5-methylcytosine-specific restriction endonuclease McrA
LHVDHLVPLAHGGTTTADNLLTACEECNLGKATRVVVALGS